MKCPVDATARRGGKISPHRARALCGMRGHCRYQAVMYIHAAGCAHHPAEAMVSGMPLDVLIADCRPIPFICVAQCSLPWAYWC